MLFLSSIWNMDWFHAWLGICRRRSTVASILHGVEARQEEGYIFKSLVLHCRWHFALEMFSASWKGSSSWKHAIAISCRCVPFPCLFISSLLLAASSWLLHFSQSSQPYAWLKMTWILTISSKPAHNLLARLLQWHLSDAMTYLSTIAFAARANLHRMRPWSLNAYCRVHSRARQIHVASQIGKACQAACRANVLSQLRLSSMVIVMNATA